MKLFQKKKSAASKMVEEIKSRGSYFPATISSKYGDIRLLVLHDDADKLINLAKYLGVGVDHK